MEWFLIAIKQIILGISLAAPVGPINIEMIKKGLTKGFWASWLVGLRDMTADILFILLILIGLTPFVQMHAVTVSLYAIGFVMLTFVGFQSMKQAVSHSFSIDANKPSIKRDKSFFTGFFIALMNPLNIVFWFGVFGSSLSESLQSQTWLSVFFHSFFIIFGILLWNLNISSSIHFTRKFITPKLLRFITLGAGFLLFLFGCQFGFKCISLIIG
ncbi:LysE family transporter [Priestia megaterium]